MRFEEVLYPYWGQFFRVDKVLFHDKTEHQDLIIFETEKFGRVMALDGIIQTTQADEFVYHEMMAHQPILTHGAAKEVLIIGGGDGGVLREALKHPGLHVTQVEIDQAVIDMAREYFPGHSDGAFDDPRAEIVIADGVDYVAKTEKRFDVIIVDSTDPEGPGAVLFTREFYASCAKCLNDGGVMVTQNGVPFNQGQEVTDSYQSFRALFEDAWFYVAPVPTYVGGVMTLGWATKSTGLRETPLDTIQARFEPLKGRTKYATPEVLKAAFALPQYVLDLMVED